MRVDRPSISDLTNMQHTHVSAAQGGIIATQLLDPAPADTAYSGVYATLTAGENITAGQVCYLKSDGNMWLAKADAVLTAGKSAIMLATAAIGVGTPGVFLVQGFYQNVAVYNMTPCVPQYISAATFGAITETAPAVATNIVRIVGYATTADIIYFCPDTTWLEI